MQPQNVHFYKTSSKIKELQFLVIFILLKKRMTNLNYKKDEGNGTSCRPRPPMLHPKLGDSSITPLRKPPLYYSSSLIAYNEFES